MDGRPDRERRVTRRILIAEPSRTLTTLIRLTLAGEGVELEFVAGGHRALERARAERPDLLITDAHLPDLDGYALAEAFRRDARLRQVAVLLTIADYESPDVERLARGAALVARRNSGVERRKQSR